MFNPNEPFDEIEYSDTTSGFNPNEPFDEIEYSGTRSDFNPNKPFDEIEQPAGEKKQTPTTDEDQGMLERVGRTVFTDSGYEWLNTPEDKELPEYQKAYKKSMAEYKAETEALRQEKNQLDAEATKHRKQKFKDTEPSELEETAWYSISNKKFTTKSMAGYYNKRKAEMVEDGTYGNRSKFKVKMYKELKEKGATTLDLQEISQVSRGLKTSAEIFGDSIGEAVSLIPEVIERKGIDPFTNRARQNALAVGSILVDVSKLNPWVDAEDRKSSQEVMLEAQAVEAGINAAYEEEYGASAINFLQAGTELIPLIAYSPVGASGKLSWSAIAFADGFYESIDSKKKGYSTLQAGAHGVIVARITKSIGGLMDVGVGAFQAVRRMGNEFKEFKNIDDLPNKYQRQIKELQKINGWSDDEVMYMVNGFKNGLEEGKLNAIDSIRLMAQNSHNPTGRSLFEESILYNRGAANKFLKESTDRSQDIISSVNKNSDLGAIIHKNTSTRYNNTSINWPAVVSQAEAKGISPNSTIMRRLKKNADVFDEFDYSYHKVLIKKGLGEATTVGEDIVRTSGQIMESFIGREIAKLTGTAYFMKMSIPKTIFKLLAKGIKGDRSALTETIEQSLVKGSNKLNPIKLKEEIKKANSHLPDDKIDDIVEGIMEAAQKSARTRQKEAEAELKARKATAEVDRMDAEGFDQTDGYFKYIEGTKKARDLERSTLARYTNTLNDLKLAPGKVSTNGKKIATVINKEAIIYRKKIESNGHAISMDEARRYVTKRISKILEECK